MTHRSIIFIFFFLCTVSLFSQAVDTSKFKMYTKLTGHSRSVESVAFSPNGKLMASGGWDNTIHVYKADTPGFATEKFVLKGHMGGITSLFFSKDNKFLASASKDFSIRVYNLENGELVFSANDHRGEATRVFVDPKSKFLMSSSLDGTLMMYEFQNATAKSRTIKYSGVINSFVPAIDGKSLYIAADKGDIDNIDFKSMVIRSLKGHTAKVNCLELSPNGKLLASGSDDKTIIIWDLATGKILKTLKGNSWKITSVAWSSDGNYLTSTCNDGLTKVWDLNTGTQLKILNTLGKNARCAAWSPNMGFILVASLMDATSNGAILYATPLQKLPPAPPVKAGVKSPVNKPIVKAVKKP